MITIWYNQIKYIPVQNRVQSFQWLCPKELSEVTVRLRLLMYYMYQINYMQFTKLINIIQRCTSDLVMLIYDNLTTHSLFINLAPLFLVMNYYLIQYMYTFCDIKYLRNYLKDTVSVRGSKFLKVKENVYYILSLWMWSCKLLIRNNNATKG